MKSILTVMQTISASGPHPIVKAELQCSTVGDLPAMYELFDGAIIGPGSISELIQPGGFVTLDDNGKWYKSDGSGEATEEEPAETLSLSPQLNLGGGLRPSAGLQAQPDLDDTEEEPEIVNVLPYEEDIEEPEKDVNDDEELV